MARVLRGEVYWADLGRENPDQFGLGDWIEMLRAQRRTGDLEVKEDGAVGHSNLCGLFSVVLG